MTRTNVPEQNTLEMEKQKQENTVAKVTSKQRRHNSQLGQRQDAQKQTYFGRSNTNAKERRKRNANVKESWRHPRAGKPVRRKRSSGNIKSGKHGTPLCAS